MVTALTCRSPSPSGVELNISRPGTPSVSPVRWQPRQRNSRLNTGRSAGSLLQRVEDDAGAGVVGGDLEQVAVAHPAERDAVVEEQRPRVRRTDQPGLEAALREQQQLRVGRQRQRVEHRRQVAAAPLEGQPRRPVVEPTVQVVDDVADRRGGVGNRRDRRPIPGTCRRAGRPAAGARTPPGAQHRGADRGARPESEPPAGRRARRVGVTETPDPACRRAGPSSRGAASRSRLAATTACDILRPMRGVAGGADSNGQGVDHGHTKARAPCRRAY